MTQPLDRNCDLPALGELDVETGEFWTGRSKDMTKNRENTSAFERNRLFLNDGKPSFLDASSASGRDIDADSRAAVAADFDRDGRTDLLVASVGGGALRLFRNESSTPNHSVTIRLQGSTVNSTGVGSRIVVRCGEKTIIRDLFQPNSGFGMGPPEQTIGLGAADRIDELVVHWAGGSPQTFRDLPIDGLLFFKEGEQAPRFRSFAALQAIGNGSP